MKKRHLLVVFTLSITLLVTACSKVKENIVDIDVNDETFSAEEIEVFIPGKSEPLEIITNPEDIKVFVDQLSLETWEVANLPADAEEGTIYKLFDRKTAQLGESIEEKELYESGSLIVYRDEPYIEFKTSLFSPSFKVPVEVNESLLKEAK